ncbi:MAG: hypothetical protein H7296_02540 [Bacteroidia bacterium]|nr:hypothetical protein [Bacteroidia bacterium]
MTLSTINYYLIILLCFNLCIKDVKGNSDERLKILKQECRIFKKEAKSLNKYLRNREKCEEKIKDRMCIHITDQTCITAIKKTGNQQTSIRLNHNPSLTKDSNYYIRKIIWYRNDIAQSKIKIANLDNSMQSYKVKINGFTQDPQKSKTFQNALKDDKRLYYLQTQMLRKQQELFQKINVQSFKKLISQTKQQNKLLSARLFNDPATQIPPQYQTKSRVQATLPQNNVGLNPMQKQELQRKFENVSTAFEELTDSINQQKLNADSISFKPDKYRSMALKDRIERNFNWQAQKSNGYFPGIIDFSISIGFKLNKKLTPQLGLLYKIGVGKSLEQIDISQQGFGLKGGVNYLFYKKVMLFISYEQTYYRAVNLEEKRAYQPMPALILGLGIKSKSTIQIGYDFLRHYNPQKGSSIILRFGF